MAFPCPYFLFGTYDTEKEHLNFFGQFTVFQLLDVKVLSEGDDDCDILTGIMGNKNHISRFALFDL